jgi:hypothetical protein
VLAEIAFHEPISTTNTDTLESAFMFARPLPRDGIGQEEWESCTKGERGKDNIRGDVDLHSVQGSSLHGHIRV